MGHSNGSRLAAASAGELIPQGIWFLYLSLTGSSRSMQQLRADINTATKFEQCRAAFERRFEAATQRAYASQEGTSNTAAGDPVSPT